LLKSCFAFAVAMLLDSCFDLLAQTKTIKRQRTNIFRSKLRSQPVNDLAQKLRRLARRNVLVIDMTIQPCHQIFE